MKKTYSIYFLNLLASGLFYSFLTAKLIESAYNNKLLIVALSAIIQIFIFLDLKTINILKRCSAQTFSILGVIIGIVAIICQNHLTIAVLMIIFIALTLIVSVLSLILENRILLLEKSVADGFINMQTYRTLAKLLGFLLGILLSEISSIYFIIFFLIIFVINLSLTYNTHWVLKSSIAKNKDKILYLRYLLILSILGVSTSLWIPLFVLETIQQGYKLYSWVPFVMPGICILIFNMIQKKYRQLQDNIIPELLYGLLLIILLMICLYVPNVFIQTFIFSIATAVGLGVSIKMRKLFIINNKNIDNKILLQAISLFASVASLVSALLLGGLNHLNYILIAVNLATVAYLILFERKQF